MVPDLATANVDDFKTWDFIFSSDIDPQFLKPRLIKPLYIIWMTIAITMGWFMTKIILTIIYFLVITPTGLIGRIFHAEFIDSQQNKDLTSFWNYREKKNISDHTKQFWT